MKDTVINYFKTDRGFASGKVLYGTLPGKSTAFNNALNRMTETPANIAKLHYELAKLVGINARLLGIMLRNPVVEVKDMEVVDPIDLTKNTATIKLEKPSFGKGAAGNRERKAFVKDKGIEVESGKTADLDKAINAWWDANVEKLQAELLKAPATKDFVSATTETKKTVKLFDKFPFLSADDCPQVFKTLVGELGASYRKYKEAHPHLFNDLTADERLEAAKDVVTPFKENKSIWAELKHYQEHGECLGKHELVKDYLRKEEIKALNGEGLAKLKHNLETNINRNKKALEGLDGKKADKKSKLITSQEEELRFVEVELKSR